MSITNNVYYKKRKHKNPHERIQGIGGTDKGTRWSRSEDNAIADVKKDTKSYYVLVEGKTVWVVVAKHEGREYLKTEADGYAPNNLLSLSDCPKLGSPSEGNMQISWQSIA
jgi:Protein of unknown function (DUF3892)